MIVAELRAVPVGSGSSMEETVGAVREALDDCEVKYEVGPVGTTFEVDKIEDLMETVQCCQEAAIETAPRVILTVTIDERRDKEETMQTLRGSKEPTASRRAGNGSWQRARRQPKDKRQPAGRGEGLAAREVAAARRPQRVRSAEGVTARTSARRP